MSEMTEAPSVTEASNFQGRRRWGRQIISVLYMIFNGACLSVYGYQIYLWVKQSAWTKIPSRLLLFPGSEHPFSGHSGAIWKILEWTLDVELAYNLCFIAMIFYGLRWWADRRVQ